MEEKIRCIRKEEEDYPERMRQLDHMPEQIYVRGRLPENKRPCAAIVGARLCSPYGAAQARRFARELCAAGVQIISGMARGIDGWAHRGALESGGDSWAVLGCGQTSLSPGKPGSVQEDGDGERRTDLGVSSWTASPGTAVSGEKQNYQCAVGCGAGGRGKGTERIADYSRFCPGTGQDSLCGSGTSGGAFKRGMQSSDRAGSGAGAYS